jgi:hypothetical protein
MDLNNKKIRADFIIEAIGRPPEYLTETLNAIIKSMGEEKGVKVASSKLNPPVEMKNQKEFFTAFAEIEVEVEHILNVAFLMFKYMPAHVEIITPEKMTITNAEAGEIFSELTRRLHGYEELTRIMQNEKIILENHLRELLSREAKGSEQVQASSVKSEQKKEEVKSKETKKEKKTKKEL